MMGAAVKGLAHRGYPKRYPENTLISFQAALDLSFSHLELDVHLTKDGIPVVIHDPTVDRTTNGTGRVIDYTLEELRKLDAGQGEKIPTLEEVLKLAKGRSCIDIELKQGGRLYPDLERITLETIQALDMMDQVFVTSFDHYSIMKMRELSEEVDLGLVLYGATPAVFPFARELRARYVSVKYIYLTPEFVSACTEHGLQVIAWTVDDEEDMKRLLREYPGIWLCTNEAETLKHCIEQMDR